MKPTLALNWYEDAVIISQALSHLGIKEGVQRLSSRGIICYPLFIEILTAPVEQLPTINVQPEYLMPTTIERLLEIMKLRLEGNNVPEKVKQLLLNIERVPL